MLEQSPFSDQQPSTPDRLRIGTVADIMKGSQTNPHIQRAIDQIRQRVLPDVIIQKEVIDYTPPPDPDLPFDGPSEI